MAATEQLTVLLRTVADTSGARQTQQALQQTERQIVATNQRVQRAMSFKDVAGAVGIGTGASQLFQQAVQATTAAIGGSVDASREHERVIRATGMAYGQAASQFQEFAKQLEATTGFTSDAILEAALSARTLSQNYGLTIQQTQKLITVSADLARVRGIGIAEAFERTQSAIRGEAEASEYLGLTLNDTYLTNQAMNGSLKNTFGSMTDVQKAQVRYNELLRQSAQFTGLAAASTDSLDAAFNRAGTSAHNAQLRLGELTKPAVLEGLRLLAKAMDEVAKTGTNVADVKIGNFLQNLGAGLDRLNKASIAGGGAWNAKDTEEFRAALGDVVQAGDRAALSTEVAVTKISDHLADLKDRYVDVEEAARKNAAALARAALTDQAQAAAQDLIKAQYEQVRLQQESVQLSAAEAQIKLSLLPAQQQMAALQRDITEQQLRARLATLPATEALQDLQRAQQVSHLIQQTNTSLQEQQIRARMAALPAAEALEDLQRAQEIARLVAQTDTSLQQNMLQARLAALPATEALEDLQFAQQRAELISRDRTRSATERSAARRELRELSRREPGVELEALEARRGVTAVGRVTERADIQQQMVNLADQAALATAQLAATQAQQAELDAKRAAERASLDQQLKDLAEQASLAVAQLAVIEAQRAQVEADRVAERVEIAAQLQAIADARALAPILDAAAANQLQQAIAAAVTQSQEAVLKQILAQVQKPGITLTVNFTLPDGSVLTATELIEANAQATIPPAIQLSGLRRG